MKLHIIFSHGKESGPNGNKIQMLRAVAEDAGLSTDSIDYTDTFDPDIRAKRLLEAIENLNSSQSYLLAGSSMGGYVSMKAAQSASHPPAGIFLMAPALFIPGYEQQDFKAPNCPVHIIHGWQDDIISSENSIHFAKSCPDRCILHLVPGRHDLADATEEVGQSFVQFLEDVVG